MLVFFGGETLTFPGLESEDYLWIKEMASRGGGFTGPPINPNVHPMNVAHGAGMRMPGMPQPPIGYPRSMNTAPQYPQVGVSPLAVQARHTRKRGGVTATSNAIRFIYFLFDFILNHNFNVTTFTTF